MDILVKRRLEADVFLMYEAARGLENARQRAEESEDNKEYWEKVVRFWERKLDRSIDLVKVTYHLYLKRKARRPNFFRERNYSLNRMIL